MIAVYVDMVAGREGVCSEALMTFNPISRVSRRLEMRFTQYRCGDDNGGPQGCLQYFSQNAGSVFR